MPVGSQRLAARRGSASPIRGGRTAAVEGSPSGQVVQRSRPPLVGSPLPCRVVSAIRPGVPCRCLRTPRYGRPFAPRHRACSPWRHASQLAV